MPFVVTGFFLACWTIALLAGFRLIDLSDSIAVRLYPFYIVAAAGGWLSGNVYVHGRGSRRRLPRRARLQRLILFLLGPPGLLHVVWAMGPSALQRAAPMVAVYATGVFVVLFMVPVTLRVSQVERSELDLERTPGSSEEGDGAEPGSISGDPDRGQV